MQCQKILFCLLLPFFPQSLFDRRICHFVYPFPFSGLSHLPHFTPVPVKEFRQLVAVNPDLVVALLLRFVKDQLQSPVEMYCLNIVDVLLRAVSGMSHVADHIPRRHDTALFQSFRVGIILPQMCVVVIPLMVKAADADAPAAVLIPAERLHIAGLDRNDRCTYANIKLSIICQQSTAVCLAIPICHKGFIIMIG